MKRIAILAALLSTAMPVGFANTNAGSKLFVCATPQNDDLDQAGYEALTWVEVGSVGSHGEVGPQTNILTYDTWNTKVIQKAKGMTDAGSPEIEVARDATDPGQDILRTAAKSNFNYAFKIVRNDKPNAAPDSTPTIIYNRGLVTGPRRPMGRNEDFDLEIFTLGLQQLEIVVDPAEGGDAPQFTVAPTITGTAEVGETLNCTAGTTTGDAVIVKTYLWFANGTPLAGANTNSLVLTADHLGDIISCRVTATNDYGVAQLMTAPTAAVGA